MYRPILSTPYQRTFDRSCTPFRSRELDLGVYSSRHTSSSSSSSSWPHSLFFFHWYLRSKNRKNKHEDIRRGDLSHYGPGNAAANTRGGGERPRTAEHCARHSPTSRHNNRSSIIVALRVLVRLAPPSQGSTQSILKKGRKNDERMMHTPSMQLRLLLRYDVS